MSEKKLIDKVFGCCIFRGLVEYEEIIAEDIE